MLIGFSIINHPFWGTPIGILSYWFYMVKTTEGFGSVGIPLQLRSLSGPCHSRPRAAGFRSQDLLLPLVRGDPKNPYILRTVSGCRLIGPFTGAWDLYFGSIYNSIHLFTGFCSVPNTGCFWYPLGLHYWLILLVLLPV